MLASRLHGLEDIRLDTVDEPTPGEGEVRVKVAHNGICGSDLHMYEGRTWGSGKPITLGHEFCGVVDGLGSGVSGVELGTRVAVRPFYKCGACSRCVKGLEHLCTPVKVLGCGADGGGLAEYCVMDAGMVFALPDGVTMEQGALVEPMAVSFNGVLRGDVEPGMRTVVFGAGPIGIGVLLGLRAKGIDDVVVVEPSAKRREAIAQLGATDVLDPTTDDVHGVVMSRTNRQGADVVFECAGNDAAVELANRLAKPGGRVVIVGIPTDDRTSFTASIVRRKALTLAWSRRMVAADMDRAIEQVASGTITLDGLVTDRFSLEEAPAAFATLEARSGLKIVIEP